MSDDVEKQLQGTPAMDEVERMRFDNHRSVKSRSVQRSPNESYREHYEDITW